MEEEKEMIDDSQSPQAELARLADGSLPASRQTELRAEVAASPELAQALSEQERAVTMVRSLDTPAPDSLRRWLEEQTQAAAPRRRAALRLPTVRFRIALPTAVALAAAVVVAIVLATGGSSGPTLQQTSHLALAAAVSPAPSAAPGNPAVLTTTGAGIPFPDWQAYTETHGWAAEGTRSDRVSGREIVTVFYKNPHGARVGYAIVSGAPLAVNGGHTVTQSGVAFTFLRYGSARVVTWLQAGHTCVIAGQGVSDHTLRRLATAGLAT